MGGAEPARTVGRHLELRAIDGLLADLVQGSSGVLVLRGEAGIGKSHLCRVASARAAAAGIRVVWAIADELEQDRPGRMLLDLESALAPAAHRPPPEGEAVVAGADPGYRIVENFLAGVDRAAALAPVLLVVEDLQWADALSLRGLSSLARSLGSVPGAVLATMRPHPAPPGHTVWHTAVHRAGGRTLDLTGLDGEEVLVLRHASLLGRHFTATELATISASEVVAVVGALDEAVRSGAVLGTGDRHEFRHDLVREAVYHSIPAAARRDLHRAAGAALAASGAPASRVASQFVAGARPDDVQAVDWLRRAAEEVLAQDTASAATLLERALSLAPAGWPDRFEVEADLVEVLAWTGRIDDAVRRGQALVDRALSAPERFRAHQALGTVRSTVGDLRAAAENLRAAAATGAADEATAAQLRCAAAGMQTIAGAEPPALARAEAAPHAGSERPALSCWARNTLAVAAVCEGAYDEVIDHARVAASILDHHHVRPLGFLIPHSWWLTGLQYVDRYDEAREVARLARARAEARGDVGLLVQVMAGTCGITWATGAWDDTLAEIDASLALADDTGAIVHTVLVHSLSAFIAWERGDSREATDHVERAEEVVASGSMHLFGLDVLAWVRARMLLDSGAVDEACELAVGVWDLTSALRGLIQWRSLGPLVIELCVATGRIDHARAVAGELAELAQRSSAPSGTATAGWARGLVDRDARLLVAAADALLATPRRVEAAAASEDAVRMLLERGGQPEDIRRLLDAAEEVHRRTGAEAAIERVASLRRTAGLRADEPSRSATFGWESLTPKELEVVRLVSEGRSNPDIAAELFISRRTVEAHLSHMFRKLGVSNRTQLARQAIERQRDSTA